MTAPSSSTSTDYSSAEPPEPPAAPPAAETITSRAEAAPAVADSDALNDPTKLTPGYVWDAVLRGYMPPQPPDHMYWWRTTSDRVYRRSTTMPYDSNSVLPLPSAEILVIVIDPPLACIPTHGSHSESNKNRTTTDTNGSNNRGHRLSV